jgi:hypothetical protein
MVSYFVQKGSIKDEKLLVAIVFQIDYSYNIVELILLLIARCVIKVWKIVLIYVFIVQVVFTVGGKRSPTLIVKGR